MIWRVRDRATFRAFRRALRARTSLVEVRVVAGESTGPPRVAYAVSKRVGGAVTRNRVRRRLRAAISLHRDALEPGYAYLVLAAPATADADFADLAGGVREALARVRARGASS